MLIKIVFIGDDSVLRNHISQLIALPASEEAIVEALCNIGKIIINDCRFRLNDAAEFIPMWVEAYYCNKDQNYLDVTMDAVKRLNKNEDIESIEQINHYGCLYFAEGKNSKYRRVDLTLSNAPDYGLSVLIKAGKIKRQDGQEVFFGQTASRDVLESQASIKWIMEKDINANEGGDLGSLRRVFSTINKATGEKAHFMGLEGLAVHRNPFVCKLSCKPETQYKKFLS